MIILALFSFMVLAEVPTWAKVVNNFDQCAEFFYKLTEPQGMDQNTRKICQKYDSGGYYYASLYSTYHKIPVYSAYNFDNRCNSQDGRKSGNWFIEPQLSGFPENTMKPETYYDKNTLKFTQALNGDYSNTGYDRGHLNPNSFQCGAGRNATFALTNSAPIDACFNRVHWKRCEQSVKGILKNQPDSGTVYLVTGTVPSKNYKIPRREAFDESGTRDFNRVTVPTHVWTAVCYKNYDNDELSFSFGYIGRNQPDSRISVMSIPKLNKQLTSLYHTAVKIFTDDCSSTNRRSEGIIKYLYSHMQLPITDKLVMSDAIRHMIYTAIIQSDENKLPSKRPWLTDVTIYQTFDSLKTWYEKTESMKYVSGLTCVLSQQFTGPITSLNSTGIQKRDTTHGSQELVCRLIPEAVSGCTTSCLYKKEAKNYYCYYELEERLCSPEYSRITVSGKMCNRAHTCGKHGYDYYWCRVGSSWDYCSPPLPMGKGKGGKACRSNHNCDFYGKKYTWCYTDYNDNWDHCCRISGDRFSALNGKTCRPDHPCDFYSYQDLWCYTTDGSWEKCCTR